VSSSVKVVRVAVAIILNRQQQVLISLRQQGQHLAGFWEFPGGKIEGAEVAEDALARELNEELGILISAAQPVFELNYSYPDKSVRLEVFKVQQFSGEPRSCEGQEFRWCALTDLSSYRFPPANTPILEYLRP
jgi:8-oxo-dGTP diphosphatase